MSSPLFCDHANETPRQSPCGCPKECYCKTNGNTCCEKKLSSTQDITSRLYHDEIKRHEQTAKELLRAKEKINDYENKLKQKNKYLEQRVEELETLVSQILKKLNEHKSIIDLHRPMR